MLFILAGLIILMVVGIIIYKKSYNSEKGMMMALIFGVIAVSVAIVWLAVYTSTISEIQSFEATKATIEQSRKGDNKLENAALTQKIIESNQWLQQTKYWKNTIFGDLYPSAVNELEPLE